MKWNLFEGFLQGDKTLKFTTRFMFNALATISIVNLPTE